MCESKEGNALILLFFRHVSKMPFNCRQPFHTGSGHYNLTTPNSNKFFSWEGCHLNMFLNGPTRTLPNLILAFLCTVRNNSVASWIWTRIVGVEGKDTDNYTPPEPKNVFICLCYALFAMRSDKCRSTGGRGIRSRDSALNNLTHYRSLSSSRAMFGRRRRALEVESEESQECRLFK